MKKLLIPLTFLAALSCKKSDPQPDPVIPASRLSATIDGKPFTASFIRAEVDAGSILIDGTRNEGTGKAETIAFSIPHYVSLTAYPVDTATSAGFYSYTGTYLARSGSIVVATFNDVHVAGTFSFSLADSLGAAKSVTAGSFDVYR